MYVHSDSRLYRSESIRQLHQRSNLSGIDQPSRYAMATAVEDDPRTKPLISYDLCEEKERPSGSFMKRIWEEEKKLFLVAGPAIITRLSTFGVSMISQAFIGHMGSTELAAYALVFTVIVRFSNGILVITLTDFLSSKLASTGGFFFPLILQLGMASALETLCGQSFGAGQHHMLGIYLQRSWLVLLPFTVSLLPLFLFAKPVLLLLGQDETVAFVAGKISLWCIGILFSYGFSFTLQMYLQAQSKNRVITYYAALSLPMHVLASWVLSKKLQLGVAGVMGSMVVAFWVPVVGQLLFVLRGGCPETWRGLSSDAFNDLGAIIKLSVSSGVMLWYTRSIYVLLYIILQVVN